MRVDSPVRPLIASAILALAAYGFFVISRMPEMNASSGMGAALTALLCALGAAFGTYRALVLFLASRAQHGPSSPPASAPAGGGLAAALAVVQREQLEAIGDAVGELVDASATAAEIELTPFTASGSTLYRWRLRVEPASAQRDKTSAALRSAIEALVPYFERMGRVPPAMTIRARYEAGQLTNVGADFH